MLNPIHINQSFDAGNIEVVSAAHATDIQLRIRPDQQSDFFQWFYFRVSGARSEALKMRLLNAAEAAFADGWDGYQALASYDQEDWFRVPTRYENNELVIEHTPQADAVYYAYFTPYSLQRHRELIAAAQCDERCRLYVAGQTVQGRDLDVLQIGEDNGGNKRVWIIARQHPGESMAEWLAEGLLERLLDDDDALVERLLQKAVFYVVPNMNPDGSTLGHLRTNAAGVNLNRVWGKADPETSPEVFYIQQMMEQTGCDLFLDIHGDESIPYNFIAGQDGAPVAEDILQQEAAFKRNLLRVNPDFQLEYGYAPDRFGPETLTLASFWVGQRFGIAAMTLEMPFKDNLTRPDPLAGWSAARSAKLGASLLNPVAEHLQVV
ncbi:MAG: M14-type cytosolic carboxypeptidase [Thiolinea sp.]